MGCGANYLENSWSVRFMWCQPFCFGLNILLVFCIHTSHLYNCSYALAIEIQEKAVDAWRGHGVVAEDALAEAIRVLDQLKMKALGVSDSPSEASTTNALPLPQSSNPTRNLQPNRLPNTPWRQWHAFLTKRITRMFLFITISRTFLSWNLGFDRLSQFFLCNVLFF